MRLINFIKKKLEIVSPSKACRPTFSDKELEEIRKNCIKYPIEKKVTR